MAGSAAQEALNAALADLASAESGAMNDSQNALAEATGDAPGTPSPESAAMSNQASNASSAQSTSAQGVQQGEGTQNQGPKANGEFPLMLKKCLPLRQGKWREATVQVEHDPSNSNRGLPSFPGIEKCHSSKQSTESSASLRRKAETLLRE